MKATFLQEFAEPFGLWECQLAILRCSGHHDPPLVESMWERILEEETGCDCAGVDIVANKVKSLAKTYAGSQKYFPMGNYEGH